MSYLWDVSNKVTYNNRTGLYKFQKEYSFIKRHLNKQSIKVLDICGGSGRFALPLLNTVDSITVLDINQEAIDILNQKASNIKTYCCDFMNFESNIKFDFVILIEAIGYFDDKELLFENINKLLNSNGLLIFQVTNPKSWRYFLRKLKNIFKKRTLYSEPNINDLLKILNNKNFEIVEIEGMNWIPLPLSSNSIFVEFFIWIESLFKLNKWINQSPWLMISVKKI
jgi:ubiquinone/menaquinone biosynthesis C-methylase UbiE